MFDKALKYSYAAQKRERHKLLRIILALLVIYLVYNAISAFLITVWVMRNDTMQPGLQSGDRFIAVSSAIPSLFVEIKQTEGAAPFRRGNIVLLDTMRGESRSRFLDAADSFVRFFTAQQTSIYAAHEHIFVKRLIGLPGDEITMVNFVLRIRPEGSLYTLTEFELSERPYYPNIPQVPALWDESLPLSGNMDKIVLGPGEYFIISDDRGSTGDSRTWGPVSAKEIAGRPVFRFWPLSRFGRL